MGKRLIFVGLLGVWLIGCTLSAPETVQIDLPQRVTIAVDGEAIDLESSADTVRLLLEEAGIELSSQD